MLPPEVKEAAKVLEDPRAPEKERDRAAHVYHGYLARQAPTSEILEHLSPQVDSERLPLQVGRRYFHSWKDTEALYREVTEWKHFSLDQCPAVSAPPDTQAAFEDIFADLIKERGAVLRLHPLYRRWTVFLKEPTADQGYQYLASIMIAESDGKYGRIPVDLENDLDKRLHPVIRSLGIGSYKVPTRQDFEHLRYQWADRTRETRRQKVTRLAREQKRLEDIKSDSLNSFIDDFVSHHAALLSRDINRKYGSMQGLPFVPGTSLDKFSEEHPEYEYMEAVDAEGRPLGYKHRRRLKPWERGDVMTPTMRRFLALQAAQGRWQAEYAQATGEDKALLYLSEPLIDEDTRLQRLNEFADNKALAREEQKVKLKELTNELIENRVKQSQEILEALLKAAREEESAQWQSRVSQQQHSQS